MRLILLACVSAAPSLAAGLRVIGAGMGRTGTDSLRHALDALGVGPTYHMIELLGISDTQTRPVSPLEMLGLAPGHNDLWAEANANISKGVAPTSPPSWMATARLWTSRPPPSGRSC